MLRRFSVILILVILITGLNAHWIQQQHDEIAQYKNEVLKTQLKYEETRNEVTHLQRELANRDDRLEKATERERVAKIRASRSRGSAGSAERPVSNLKRSSAGQVELRSEGRRDITMYCPTGNRTASGKTPQRGMVATISRSIPFGTRIRIEGLGEYVVEDRIGHGSEFDIFTPSCAEADRFGREHRRVTILS